MSTTYVYPYAALAIAEGEIDLATSLAVLLIDAASTPYTWNATSQAHQFVADVLSGSGAGALTEVSTASTGYTRKLLTGVSAGVSGQTMQIQVNNVLWPSATFAAAYAVFYENAHTTDATRRVVCYWDLTDSIKPANNGNVTLAPPGGVLLATPVNQ